MYRFLDRVHSYPLHSDHAKHTEHATHSIDIDKDDEQQTEHKLREALRVQRHQELQQCQINLASNSKFVTHMGDGDEPENKAASSNEAEPMNPCLPVASAKPSRWFRRS